METLSAHKSLSKSHPTLPPASLFRLPQDTPRRALAGSLFISESGSIPVSAQDSLISFGVAD